MEVHPRSHEGLRDHLELITSGIDALRQLQRTLNRHGVSLVLAAVNEQPCR
jgi:aryl carrier-like protein